MIEPTKYVMCGSNCKYPAYTAEEVLALLQQAIDNKSLDGIVSDTGFITKIKEKNSNKAMQLWIGTQAQYAALETKPQDTLCIFTDDSTAADLNKAAEDAKKAAEAAVTNAVSGLESSIKNGTTKAAHATKADQDGEGTNIANNYAKKTELVKVVTLASGSSTVETNATAIVVGEAPTGKTSSDIIGISFYANGYHLSTMAGGAQNANEFDCTGTRIADDTSGVRITFAAARTECSVVSGEVRFKVKSMVKQDGTSITNYAGTSITVTKIYVYFK